MDPSKTIGKIREQVEKEHTSRRNYHKKYGNALDDRQMNQFYNQDAINKQLRALLTHQGEPDPHEQAAAGEHHFVSPEMYKSLVASCRCGRPRTEAHLLKCLQREQRTHQLPTAGPQSAEDGTPQCLPQTSNAFIGWRPRQNRLSAQWEQSTRYVSPVQTMPGPKVTATPYNVIFIG